MHNTIEKLSLSLVCKFISKITVKTGVLLNEICKHESELVEYRDCTAENLLKRELRTNPNENTDSGQYHQYMYITSPFGEFKCLLFVHCDHLSIS